MGRSKISNTEWGMVIGALFIVDLIQVGLDLFFQVGVIANRFIDIVVGLAWPTYLYLRGVNMNVKRVGSIILSFAVEQVPDVDALPFWSADGVFIMLSVKITEKAMKKNAAAAATAVVVLAPETGSASSAEGAAEAGAVGTEATGAVTERAEAVGATSGKALETEGPGVSDEYADAMGRESDENYKGQQSEPDDYDTVRDESNFDTDRDISDEDADELGGESDNRLGGDNESDKSDKKKSNVSRNPVRKNKQAGAGRFPSQRGQEENSNNLDLRQPESREEAFGSQEKPDRFHSNLLDLSNSYRGGLKNRNDESGEENEKKQNETGFTE